jgi:hypothetical protein
MLVQHPNGTVLDRTEPRTTTPLEALRAIAENKPGVQVDADLYYALGGPDIAEFRAARILGTPTAISVPPLHASSEVTFSLSGPDVVIEVKLHYSAPVDATFPDDVADDPELDSLTDPLDAADWLPTPAKRYSENEPWLSNIVQQAVHGGELDGMPAEEWLRQQAERYLNEVCTEIRRGSAGQAVSTR